MKQMNSFWQLIVMVIVVLNSLISCGGDDAPDGKLEVSPENILLSKNGENVLSITSNTKWEVSTTASWLTFSTMSGVGNERVTLRAIGSSKSERMAIVTVKSENNTRQVVVTQAAVLPQKYYIYGDVANFPDQKPFQPGAWDAMAMRFSDTEGRYFPTIPDEVYFGLKTLILDVSNASDDCKMRVMNGWWSNTYADGLEVKTGLMEIKITEQMAKECAIGGEGKDLQLMLTSGSCTMNSVYYEE